MKEEEIIKRLKAISAEKSQLEKEERELEDKLYDLCPFIGGEKVFIDLYDSYGNDGRLKETVIGFIRSIRPSQFGFNYSFNKCKKDGTISYVQLHTYGGHATPRKFI